MSAVHVLWDLIQSLALILWLILTVMMSRRVERLKIRVGWLETTKAIPPDPEPICGCTHHHCFHDENGCGHIEVRYSYPALNLNPQPLSPTPCGCKRYTGPEPLPKYITGEI